MCIHMYYLDMHPRPTSLHVLPQTILNKIWPHSLWNHLNTEHVPKLWRCICAKPIGMEQRRFDQNDQQASKDPRIKMGPGVDRLYWDVNTYSKSLDLITQMTTDSPYCWPHWWSFWKRSAAFMYTLANWPGSGKSTIYRWFTYKKRRFKLPVSVPEGNLHQERTKWEGQTDWKDVDWLRIEQLYQRISSSRMHTHLGFDYPSSHEN